MDNTDNPSPADPYRLALRPGRQGELDDVVVQDVSIFRAEQMNDTTWWMACYLNGTEYDQISFGIKVVDGKLEVTVLEYPDADVSYEAGSIVKSGD